jgi:hypothetical protein
MTVFSWQRELEIARREGGAWRLYGTQDLVLGGVS